MQSVSERGGRLDEAVALDSVEDVCGDTGWIAPRVGDPPDRGGDEISVEIDLSSDEIVGARCLDIPLVQGVVGEVAEVVRDNQPGACADGGRQDVPVVWVG